MLSQHTQFFIIFFLKRQYHEKRRWNINELKQSNLKANEQT